MLSLAHTRSSDICFRLYEKSEGAPYLLGVSATTKEMLDKVERDFTESAYIGLQVTRFESSLRIEANENYDLVLVAEAIADFWEGQKYVVGRKRGTHDEPYDVKTFLRKSDHLRASEGKYTQCYGRVARNEAKPNS